MIAIYGLGKVFMGLCAFVLCIMETQKWRRVRVRTILIMCSKKYHKGTYLRKVNLMLVKYAIYWWQHPHYIT